MSAPAQIARGRIPLLDLPAQYRAIQAEVDEAMRRVVERGAFILGPELAEFEAAFAAYSGAAFGVGVGSGTDALFLALRALDVQPGDEVIVPAMTFAATATAVLYCGAKPVFADVLPGDLQIDPAAIEAAITPRTKGVIPVHLYGMMSDMESINSVAERHGIWVLEDAAQSHGASRDGARAGSVGAMGCFSFYPGKNLGAYGDGGMVVTSDAELAKKLRLLRDHGQASKYEHVLVGYCSRLDNLQGAVLGVKLRYLDGWNAARLVAAKYYDEVIGDRVERIGANSREGSVLHQYTVRIPNGRRDAVAQALREQAIEVGVHYPQPVHKLPVFVDMGYGAAVCSVAEQAAAEVLSLPVFPEISRAQQDRVVEALLAAIA